MFSWKKVKKIIRIFFSTIDLLLNMKTAWNIVMCLYMCQLWIPRFVFVFEGNKTHINAYAWIRKFIAYDSVFVFESVFVCGVLTLYEAHWRLFVIYPLISREPNSSSISFAAPKSNPLPFSKLEQDLRTGKSVLDDTLYRIKWIRI